MRHLGPIVQSLVLPMLHARHDVNLGSGVALQFVRDQDPWRIPQALEELTEKPFGCLPVAPALHQDVEGMAILIDSSPEVLVLALDRQYDFVEMPFVAAPRLTSPQLSGKLLAEPQRPLADRLVRYGDAPAGHQFLNVAKAQREPEVEPDYVADNFTRVAKAAVKLSVCHPDILRNSRRRRQLDSTDSSSAATCNKARR